MSDVNASFSHSRWVRKFSIAGIPSAKDEVVDTHGPKTFFNFRVRPLSLVRARINFTVRHLILVGLTYGYSLERVELFQLASVACIRGIADLLGLAVSLLHD